TPDHNETSVQMLPKTMVRIAITRTIVGRVRTIAAVSKRYKVSGLAAVRRTARFCEPPLNAKLLLHMVEVCCEDIESALSKQGTAVELPCAESQFYRSWL